MSCGVGRSHSLDLMLLWLWYRLAAVAVIRPLAWELPYAVGAALKRKKKNQVEYKNQWFSNVRQWLYKTLVIYGRGSF